MFANVATDIENRQNPLTKWWHSRDFLQKRILRFCFSMLVMVLCFPLYYLGIFGSVEGPLHPARIGQHLAGLGVTRSHCMILFLTFLIISVSWNWIFNLVSLLIGSRLTCKRSLFKEGHLCGAAVVRHKVMDPKTGQKSICYVCAKGHKRPDAYFHPVRKGTFSHSIWLVSLVFCAIVFFMS